MIDHHAQPPADPGDPAALRRRQFLALVTGTLACGGACHLARAATDRPVDVGRIADYPHDGIFEKFIQYDLFIIRRAGRLFACTAVCPHKANLLLLDPKQPDRIICSGHESTFDLDGRHHGGPARRALDRFALSLSPAGRLIVDTARTFRQPQWNDPASFVPIQ